MMKFTHRRSIHLPLVLVVAWSTGCTDSGSKKKPEPYEGVANSINLQTKEVSMTVVREDGSEHQLDGMVRDDTEVWINGRQQTLKDVIKGDQVRAYVIKDESEGKYIVVKVEVDRPLSWKKPVDDEGGLSDEAEKSPTVAMTSTKEPVEVPQPVVSDPPADIVDREPVRTASSPIKSREDAEDMIYGQVRLRMEIAIENRKNMLASGSSRNDPQVADLERQIGKARTLLLEHGEIVGEVHPPI